MATYCRHPYIHLRARSYVSLRSGGSILLSKAGPFLASGEALGSDLRMLFQEPFTDWVRFVSRSSLQFVHPLQRVTRSDYK